MIFRCQFSRKNNVAITGSTGFIGERLKSCFPAQDFVHIAAEEVPKETVFVHLAANISNSREALLNNIEIDSRLLEIANKNRSSVIYASTNNVYPLHRMCSIEDELSFNDYYSTSKIFGEKLFLNFLEEKILILRLSDVFGSGQKHGNLFKAIEKSVKEKVSLNLYNSGSKTRTYIHVDELARLICFYLRDDALNINEHQKIVNVGYSDSASVKEIIEIASKQANLPINHVVSDVDTSLKDVRTLNVSFPEGYLPLWDTFNEAFCFYINKLN